MRSAFLQVGVGLHRKVPLYSNYMIARPKVQILDEQAFG